MAYAILFLLKIVIFDLFINIGYYVNDGNALEIIVE